MDNNSKPSFGAPKVQNRNYLALLTEMTTWRKENPDCSWPAAQEYVNMVNANWGIYSSNDFRYRYTKATKEIDEKLSITNTSTSSE